MKNREQTFSEGERRSPGPDDILKRKINELGLRLEGTVLESLVKTLESDLVRKGIGKVKPVCYLTDEWGCPEGIPIIGIPYYLADEKVRNATEEVVEGENEAEILRYLRHEMGHVFSYAYRLYAREDWNNLFGPYSRPYLENYTYKPFSRDYVRHIAGWYAQKHPDEDWAETFAVWLTPESDWEKIYGAKALKKLQYADRVVKEMAGAEPVVPQPGGPDATFIPVGEIDYTVGEYIERYREEGVEVPPFFDGDLRDLFDGRPEREDAEPAGEFLARHRHTIVKRVSHWTGVREGVVGSLVDHLVQRATALNLLAERRRTSRRLIDIIAYTTTLSMNYLYQGSFIPGQGADAAGADGAKAPTPAGAGDGGDGAKPAVATVEIAPAAEIAPAPATTTPVPAAPAADEPRATAQSGRLKRVGSGPSSGAAAK